jgi:hypothetical protein
VTIPHILRFERGTYENYWKLLVFQHVQGGVLEKHVRRQKASPVWGLSRGDFLVNHGESYVSLEESNSEGMVPRVQKVEAV